MFILGKAHVFFNGGHLLHIHSLEPLYGHCLGCYHHFWHFYTIIVAPANCKDRWFSDLPQYTIYIHIYYFTFFFPFIFCFFNTEIKANSQSLRQDMSSKSQGLTPGSWNFPVVNGRRPWLSSSCFATLDPVGSTKNTSLESRSHNRFWFLDVFRCL